MISQGAHEDNKCNMGLSARKTFSVLEYSAPSEPLKKFGQTNSTDRGTVVSSIARKQMLEFSRSLFPLQAWVFSNIYLKVTIINTD
jgi:hypothetical protein